jgi:hypothetical protein
MNVSSILIWGFAATLILTSLLVVFRTIHLTRMDIPFLLGTIFTSDRHRAKWMGFLIHIAMGFIFAFIYAWAFEEARLFHWWFGALVGFVQAIFVLTAGMSIVATIHPRMATEDQGPDPTRTLEPPGFMILNYGRGTPLATILVHLIYGGILGAFYH